MVITPQTILPTRKPQLSALGCTHHDWTYNQQNHFFSWNQPQNMGDLNSFCRASLINAEHRLLEVT